MSALPVHTYRFGPLDRSGLVLGLSGRQCAALGAGAFLAGWLLDRHAPPPLVLAPFLVALTLAFIRVGGEPVCDVLPAGNRFATRAISRSNRWLATIPHHRPRPIGASPAVDLPPFMAGLTLIDAGPAPWTRPTRLAGVGVVVDRRTRRVSGTLRVHADGFCLADRGDQERLVAGWGDALAGFCREGGPVSSVRWTEWMAPTGLEDCDRFLDEHGTGTGEAVTEYRQLLAPSAPTGVPAPCSRRSPRKRWPAGGRPTGKRSARPRSPPCAGCCATTARVSSSSTSPSTPGRPTSGTSSTTGSRWNSTPSSAELEPGLITPLVAARSLWNKDARLRGSVFATMENVLAGYADPKVADTAEGCEIDLAEWLSGNHTIYVVATAHEQARLRPVLTVLVQQTIRAAYDAAAAETSGRLPHPCLVLLDEAGNTAPLRDLPGYASTARSHGITLVSVWQDLAQIRAIYRDRAQTVLNNHRAKLFGTGIADEATLEYVSRLVGDERRTERTFSGDLAGGRRSLSEHTTYRRAAPIDVIRRIRTNEGVLVYGSELPAHVRLRPYYRDPELSERARLPRRRPDNHNTRKG